MLRDESFARRTRSGQGVCGAAARPERQDQGQPHAPVVGLEGPVELVVPPVVDQPGVLRREVDDRGPRSAAQRLCALESLHGLLQPAHLRIGCPG